MSVTAIILACLVTAYWLFRSRNNPPPPRTLPSGRRQPNPYRAVSISHRGGACAAVKALGNKRYPVAQAPRLPLLQCDEAKCNCRYTRHEDQRVLGDRRNIFGLQSDTYALTGKPERRSVQNRRKKDLGPDKSSTYGLDDIEWTT